MKDVCAIYDIRRLDEIILLTKTRILEMTRRKINHIYHAAPYKWEKEIEKLTVYLPLLDKQRQYLVMGYEPCLSLYEMQCFYEVITKIIGKSCDMIYPDLFVDESNEEVWATRHPECQSYEVWEKLTKTVCAKLELEFDFEVEKQCDLVLEIMKESVSCDALLAVSVYKESCELDLKVDRSIEECALDFTLLLEKVPNCDIDLKTYIELVECNLSFDIIKTIYSCGLSLVIDHGEVMLKTPVNVYPLSQVQGIPNIAALEEYNLKPSIKKSDLLQDYK